MSADDLGRPIVLLGARGMLGQELALRLPAWAARRGAGGLLAWDLSDLDICDADAVRRTLTSVRPGVVINAAAFTDVDGCETQEAAALAVNGAAPGHLADAAARIDAKFVHISTDFVFDGQLRRPYRPEDAVHPLSAYGRSKLEGERRVQAVGGDWLIVRTSWLFGPRGRNFVEAILRRALAGEALRVVDDQQGRPTHAGDLADAVLALLDAEARGLWHFANTGACSWHAFAEEIVRQAGCDVPVARISSAELDRPAPRPAYSVLDTEAFAQATGQTPADWRDALARYLAERASLADGAHSIR